MRINTSILTPKQLPEFVQSDYPIFIAFLQAYYDFVDKQNLNLGTITDIDSTLDAFIIHFKKQYAVNFPEYNDPDLTNQLDPKVLIPKLKDFYLSKGSENSYELLFQLLYQKTVRVTYPGDVMLKVSDGRWEQEKSIFVKVKQGDINTLVGNVASIVTSKAVLKTYVLKYKVAEKVSGVTDEIYEVFIDRKILGTISVGDKLILGTFYAFVIPTISKVKVVEGGTGFKVGQIFSIPAGLGVGTKVKVTQVGVDGKLVSLQLIQFGGNYPSEYASLTKNLNSQDSILKEYTTTASAIAQTLVTFPEPIPITSSVSIYGTPANGNVVNISGYTTAPKIGTIIEASNISYPSGHPLVGTHKAIVTVVPTDGSNTYTLTTGAQVTGTSTSGTAYIPTGGVVSTDVQKAFSELAYITKYDYTSVDPVDLTTKYVDFSYVGSKLGEFTNTVNPEVVVDPAKLALIELTFGSTGIYPGYYTSNKGFISDTIFIQDSRYYQTFSYSVGIDMSLAKYKNLLKSLIHPAGFALFGEYEFSKEFPVPVTINNALAKITSTGTIVTL